MKLIPAATIASAIAGILVATSILTTGASLAMAVGAFVAEFIFCFICTVAIVKGIPALASWHLDKQITRRAR